LFTTPIISRLAAVLLLITAIFAVYTLLVEPILSGYSETGRQMEEARDQLARFERAAAMRPALAKRIEDFEEQRRSQGHFLTGGTDALAAAGLQDQVQGLIIEKGGTLQSIQPMPGVAEQGFTRITLRLQMAGTTETLFDVLYALESGNPILFIDHIEIQSRDSLRTGSDADSATGRLRVAVDLSGYLPQEPQR
jgi:Tfp pilus assembly protein PilO